MSNRISASLVWREHFLAYVLASACDIILLIPLSQLASRSGQQIDIVLSIGLHQLLIVVLLILLSLSGAFPRTWRWQYVLTAFLFAGYVAVRMSARFLAGLELIDSISGQGMSLTGALPMLYFSGLSAAAAYTGMVLSLRRAYGRLVSARSSLRRPGD